MTSKEDAERIMSSAPKNALSSEQLDIIHERRKEIAAIFFDVKKDPVDRNQYFDELRKIHKYLDLSDKLFPAKDPKKVLPKGTSRTNDQRTADVKKTLPELWKFALEEAKKEIPEDIVEQNIGAKTWNIDKNLRDRRILAQTFLKCASWIWSA